MLDFKESRFKLPMQSSVFTNNQNITIIDSISILKMTHIYS